MTHLPPAKYIDAGAVVRAQTYQEAIKSINPAEAIKPFVDGLAHSKRDVRYYRDQCIHDEQVPDMDIRLRSADMIQRHFGSGNDSDMGGHGRIELRIKLEALREKVNQLKRVTPNLIEIEQD